MAKEKTEVTLYIPKEFSEEWQLFVKIISKDPHISELVAKNRANKKRRTSIALRELIKFYNNKKRQTILAEQNAAAAAESAEEPA